MPTHRLQCLYLLGQALDSSSDPPKLTLQDPSGAWDSSGEDRWQVFHKYLLFPSSNRESPLARRVKHMLCAKVHSQSWIFGWAIRCLGRKKGWRLCSPVLAGWAGLTCQHGSWDQSFRSQKKKISLVPGIYLTSVSQENIIAENQITQ